MAGVGAEVGAGDGGAVTVGSSICDIYRIYEGIWRACRIIRAGSPYFLTTIPSSKGLALASGFNLIFCSGRFPKEGGMNGLSELRECQ